MSRLAINVFGAAMAICLANAGSAEPRNFVDAPARREAPVRLDAAMFDLNANLAEAGSLNHLLLASGVSQGDAASATALAQGQVDDRAAVRVKLGLSRNPDSGAISLQRMVLSTAATQTVFEQRNGKMCVVSSAARKVRSA